MEMSGHSRKRPLPQIDEFPPWGFIGQDEKRTRREIIELSSDSDEDLKIVHFSPGRERKDNRKEDRFELEEELECVICGTCFL